MTDTESLNPLRTRDDLLAHYASDFPDYQHISVKHARKLFDQSKKRFGKDGRLEIRINGKWLKVGRTDLKDNVATYRDYFLNSIQFGARISDEYFHCIDSYSDG